MVPAGALWPNGEFSVGYAPRGGMEEVDEWEEVAQKWTLPTGLVMGPNSHKREPVSRARRGLKGLSSYGRRMVRNAVVAIERRYGRNRLSFGTVTLPHVTVEEGWLLSSEWAEVVRKFFQKLGRYLVSVGLPGHYVSVTELQPKRAAETGHPALHLHFVFVGRRWGGGRWLCNCSVVRRLWTEVLEPYLGKERNYRAVENVVGVRGSPSAYMAKYMTKGVPEELRSQMEQDGRLLPTAWYSASIAIKRYVVANTRTHPVLMEYIEKACLMAAGSDEFVYMYGVSIDGMSGPGPHAFVGKLAQSAMEELIDVWRCSVLNTS